MDTPLLKDRDPLKPSHTPQQIPEREQEYRLLHHHATNTQENLHVHGPRGTGKTLTLLHVTAESNTPVHHIDCKEHDTTKKALSRIHQKLTGETIHANNITAPAVVDPLPRNATLILDNADFLLAHDTCSIAELITLPAQIIIVTAAHPHLKNILEDRVYNRLQPLQIRFQPYTVDEITDILFRRANTALHDDAYTTEAIDHIAIQTGNAALAIIWLGWAASYAEDTLTADIIAQTYSGAIRLYWDFLLKDASEHHHYLLEAIAELTAGPDNTVYTGEIYERYNELCKSMDRKPRTQRRVADFLTDLQLLGIVDAEYYYGGSTGKTREFRLVV